MPFLFYLNAALSRLALYISFFWNSSTYLSSRQFSGWINRVYLKMIKKEDKSNNFKKLRIYIEIFSVLFWAYLVVKLFVFDIDFYLIQNYLPQQEWIITYKFFIVI